MTVWAVSLGREWTMTWSVWRSVSTVGIERLIVAVVRRSQTAYPNLLPRDVVLEPGHVRRVKYVSGTLFYRRGSQTVAESPYGDIESLARELAFSEAAPRARTSFVLQEDRPGLRLYAPINAGSSVGDGSRGS